MSETDRAKWNARHRESEAGDPAGALLMPEPFLAEAVSALATRSLPRGRQALDIASGRGRHALALARAGFDVLALDVSHVAMAELSTRARREGLSVEARAWDLDQGLPDGVWDLVVAFHFLDRALFPALRAAIASGGALIFETFTTAHSERTGFSRAFCLSPGELAREADGLEILVSRESSADGRDVASLLAARLP